METTLEKRGIKVCWRLLRGTYLKALIFPQELKVSVCPNLTVVSVARLQAPWLIEW